MLIDTHCHLTDSKFTDVKKTIAEARETGVEKILIPSGNVEDSKRGVIIAEQEGLYSMVGVHPEEVENLYRLPRSPKATLRSEYTPSAIGRTGSNDEVVDQMVYELEEIVGKSKRVIGIGEIGLDFFFDKEKKTKEKQVKIFEAQMQLAVRLKMPVVIHMREAEEEMLAVLTKMAGLPRGQFHCFAGSENFLKYVLEKGFCVSFAGNITYKSAEELRRLVHLVPLDRLLLETDSPYLAPEPVRGTVNTPANVKIIATAIAQELSLDTQKLIEQTGRNAQCLYSLDIS